MRPEHCIPEKKYEMKNSILNWMLEKGKISFFLFENTRLAQRPRMDLNQIKSPYPVRRLPQHESLYPIGLISAKIKSYTLGTFLLCKMTLDVNVVKLLLY